VLVVAEVSVVAAVFVPQHVNATPWDASVAEALAAAIAWWSGENVRVRRAGMAERTRVEQRLASFAERDALSRERARIARELHDVVAHHVSTIAVRSAMLPYEIDDLSPRARAALAEIAQDARAALTDLRAVLGVLRSGESVSEAPLPGLADLPALITRVRGGGTRVSFSVEGDERALPDGLQVCGFRIVQEALTNAVRHASGSKVHVQLVYGAEELTVVVRDDGGGPDPTETATATAGGGYGLIGMRERVAMLGGRLTAGPRSEGGFEVVAVLPALGYEGAQL
jgi:signal transduction histidine kinase